MIDDPARAMRIARALAAKALGVDELPPDAEVECALGEDGVLHVHGRVLVPASIEHVTIPVTLKLDDS